MLDKWDLCFVIFMFLSNNPSSWDINSSNLSCLHWISINKMMNGGGLTGGGMLKGRWNFN